MLSASSSEEYSPGSANQNSPSTLSGDHTSDSSQQNSPQSCVGSDATIVISPENARQLLTGPSSPRDVKPDTSTLGLSDSDTDEFEFGDDDRVASSDKKTQSPAHRASTGLGTSTRLRDVRLPPCAVCSGKATGLHYGVNSCEACKGFFARFLTRKIQAKCKAKGACRIEAGRRCCAACRYKKCLALGMSKDSIKMGRCSHERKTKIIEEIKSLELKGRIRDDGRPMTNEEHYTDMDNIIQDLTSTHLTNTPSDNQFFASVFQQEALFKAKKAMEEQLFGERRPIPREEYNQIFSATGLDVDGRKQFIAHLLPMLEKSILHLVEFAKHVPGFIKLPPQDQIHLLKASCFECWMIQFHYTYNCDDELYVSPYNTSVVMRFADVMSYQDTPDDTYRRILSVIRRTQELELTQEETVLLSGFTILIADAELSPEGSRVLSASIDYLTEMLLYLLDKNHDPQEQVFPRIISIIRECRSLVDHHKQYFRLFMEDNKDLGVPNSVCELFSE